MAAIRVYKNRIMARSPYYITATGRSSGTITLATAVATNTVTVNGLLYTGVAGAKSGNTQFSVDTSDTAAAADLADSITNDTRTGTLNDVIASSALGVVTVSQTVGGVGGDATTLAKSGAPITISGATFDGGDDTLTSATLTVYVWSGVNTTPATADYTITKNALTTTSTNIVFEISSLVGDIFDHLSTVNDNTHGTDFIDCVWVETSLAVVQSSVQPAIINNLYLGFDGYSYYEQSYDIGDAKLSSVGWNGMETSIKKIVKSGDDIRIPVFVNDEDGCDRVQVYDTKPLVDTTYDFTTESASTDSADKVQYIEYSVSDDDVSKIVYRNADAGLDTRTENIFWVCEPKYTTKILKYLTKVGVVQELVMFKKTTESLTVNREKYNGIITSVVSDVYTYDSNKHQYKTYNVNARERITLNSGWVYEEMNEDFKQVLLSEFVWLDDVPVNVITSNLQYKTNLNDKVKINYTLDLEYSKDVVNNA